MTEVRKFGLLFGALGAPLGAYWAWKGNPLWPWPVAAAALFAVSGVAAPRLLRPVYVAWMKLAFVLGWVNTRVLLSVFYYLVLTPLGTLLRLFGKDFLDERIDRTASSYWVQREDAPFDPQRYRRLF